MNWEHKSRTISWIPAQRCIVVILALLFTTSLHAALEGFGTSTPGGANGDTTVVNSLADSGPGTLRAALAKGNNQRIVFAVGGTIKLLSRLEIRGQSFITIDGSTAPAPGITLEGHALYVRDAHDIIITHVRVRKSVGDGVLVWDNSYNVVIDHCSLTDAADENVNITEDTRNVTISWCIIGDTRSNSFALKSKGALIANFDKPPVTNVSLHHNLFINEFQRSPQVSTAGLFDIRNNVILNWGSYGIRMRAGAWGNIVNNVFKTNKNARNAVILGSDSGSLHIAGNQGPGSTNVNSLSTHASPFPVAAVQTDPAIDVENKVFMGAGAFPRDSVDTLLAGASIQNQTPVADAGSDQFVSEGTVVSFSGEGSNDPDGDPLTYTWDFGDGKSGTGLAATHTYLTAGTYIVMLTVRDGNSSASDTAQITVVAPPPTNSPPVAAAGPDQTVTAGGLVSFSGAGSRDPDGDPLTYVWDFGDGTSGTGVTTTHAYSLTGTYGVTLTASDDKGADGTDSMTITVTGTTPTPPPPPTSGRVTPTVAATLFYVSPSGKDTNLGTATSPFATIGKAASVMASGDGVVVYPGTYDERVFPPKAQVLFFADFSQGEVICGGFTLPRYNGGNGVIIDGFTITGSPGNGITLGRGSDNHEIKNNIIYGNGKGIYLAHYSKGIVLKNNLIVQNASIAIHLDRESTFEAWNNTLYGNGEGVVLEHYAGGVGSNNIVANNIGTGIQKGRGNRDFAGSYNLVFGNGNDYSGYSPGPGSLQVDPLLVDPISGDFHLSATSPAIDAGSDMSADLELDAYTTQTDKQPDTGRVDIGYHYPS